MASEFLLENSSVRRALEIVAEPWTFLVLREAWFGIRRFDHFRETLGIPRGTLTARLKHLVAEGLLGRVRYQDRPPRHEYRLTERGDDMYRPMIVILRWGDRWLAGPSGPPVVLIHEACGRETFADVACSHCVATIDPYQVAHRPGPGAGLEPRPETPRMRRTTRPDNLTRPRADSVARTMAIIGDRWSFLLIREAFYGTHRFDEVRRKIGIASNILSDRLQRLVEAGVFERQPYADGGKRLEYRFTEKGRDLYPSMLALMAWGDRWIAGAGGKPTDLHHTACDHDFEPVVVCHECREEIVVRDMTYRTGPGWDVTLGEGLLGVSGVKRASTAAPGA